MYDDERCDNCKYYFKKNVQTDVGICRFYPPMSSIEDRPKVIMCNFCSKWTRREGEIKMRRQAMQVTPNELRLLAAALQEEFVSNAKVLGVKIDMHEIRNKKFQVNIVNNSKCSDTWQFE